MRGSDVPRLTPMGINYDTVGNFYTTLSLGLRALVERCGEEKVFCGDPALQISLAEFGLSGAKPVICVKTALAAFESIVMQGEGAPRDMMGSHFQRFLSVREELLAFQRKRPGFAPAFPAATNPVLRRPPRPEGPRVDRGRRSERGRRSRQRVVQPDAASVRLRLPVSRAGRGEGAGPASGDRHDARDRAAGGARGAASCRTVESGLSCRHVVHDAARRFAAAARVERRACSSSSDCSSWPTLLPRSLAGGDRRVQSAAEHLLALVASGESRLRPERAGARRGCASGGEEPRRRRQPRRPRRSSTASSTCRARSWS